MTGICILSEVSKIISDMIPGIKGGMTADPLDLPFHLCSLMIFAVPFVTFAKDGKAKSILIDFIAAMGVLGSIAAILIPTNGTAFNTIFAYQCFVYHAGLLWFALYLIIAGHARLGLRAWGRSCAILLGLVFAMLYINSALSVYGTNFMYVVRPPMESLPFLNLDHGWYVYFAHLLSAGSILVSLYHLPFIIHEAARKKKA